MKINKINTKTYLFIMIFFLSYLAGCGGSGWEFGEIWESPPLEGFECIFFPYDSQCGSYSGVQISHSLSSAPDPMHLDIVSVFPDQIDLIWDDLPDEYGFDGYDVYRNGQYLESVLDTFYSDVTLSPGTTYCYTVSAFSAEEIDSILVGELCVTTPTYLREQ